MWIRIQVDMDIFGIPDQQANLCGFGKLILIHMFLLDLDSGSSKLLERIWIQGNETDSKELINCFTNVAGAQE